MNTMALMQATREKEMINLITNLMKYRAKNGREQFLNVLVQMNAIIELNENTKPLSEEEIKKLAME